ncbi:hypothetical protein [Burkholderia ubonensis]|uniref:hypothetical protein n=1 Tax=Burkholderia ubonensis TaxID=101571 RepID=UPI001E2D5B4D|nr:hypothetical protein [Burkholderia ubonensis]
MPRKRLHDVTPRVPGLRPAGDQQDRIAASGAHAVHALSVDADVLVREGVGVIGLQQGLV